MSWSQSTRSSWTCWIWPLVAPLCQSSRRDRLQYQASPVAMVRAVVLHETSRATDPEVPTRHDVAEGVGDEVFQVLGRPSLHAGRDLFREQFEQEVGHGTFGR